MSVTSKIPQSAAPGLPSDYRLIKQEETPGHIRYTVKCVRPLQLCPHCGGVPKPWGSKATGRVFADFPRGTTTVDILVIARRGRCTQCKATYLQELPALHTTHGMTYRYFLWVGEQCFHRSYADMGRMLGIRDTSVRQLFLHYLEDLESRVRIRPTQALALMPVTVVNKACTALVNAEALTIVDLVAGQGTETPRHAADDRRGVLEARLAQLAVGWDVRSVAIGFNEVYRQRVREFLPNATLYVDPFFVLEMAGQCLEQVRRDVRQPLSVGQRRFLAHDAQVYAKDPASLTYEERKLMKGWFGLYPALGEAYRAREALWAVYEAPKGPDEAFSALTDVLRQLDGEVRARFEGLSAALALFEAEIKTFFTLGAQDLALSRLPGLEELETWLSKQTARGSVFEVARANLLFPKTMPGKSFSSPGAGLRSLKREAEGSEPPPR